MRSFFLAISLTLTLCGCERSRAPSEVTTAHVKSAEFRNQVIKPNVETLVVDLATKLETKWSDENKVRLEFELFKLKLVRADKLKALTENSKIEETVKIFTEYEDSVEKLQLQMTRTNETNHEKLQVYLKKNLGKIKEQFDKVQRVDTALARYMMGLKSGPFDNFLVGSTELIDEGTLDDKKGN